VSIEAAAQTPILVLAGVLGLLVGSFLNVVIHRLPLRESVVSPPSRCPSCGARISPRDNVPVISWLLLRGKCRSCGARISIRYPIVELANAILWVLVLRTAPSWGDAATGAFLASSCLALLFIDLDHEILPDAITLSGIVIGLALSFFSVRRTPLQAVAAAAAAAAVLLAFRWTYEKVTGHEGMGLGDVKMLGMMGASLGLWGVVFATLVASVSGSVVGLIWIRAKGGSGKTAIRFGPFLALGAVASWFFAEPVFRWYRSFFPQ
jgi:leader peptidase (prepilin peptidase)/N-methyltransferase